MSDSSEDRELLARLQAADPAPRAPVPPDRWISDLTEATMTGNDTDQTRSGQTRSGQTRSSQGHRRTWMLVAAAAVVVGTLGVGAVAALSNRGDQAPPTAGSTTPSVTELTAPAESTAMCAIPDSGILADYADTAVDAVVVSVDGDQVTLDVSHWYVGEPTDQLVVTAPPAEMAALLGSVDLEQDVRYLLAGTDGELMICGLSGRYDNKLSALYDEAFVK